jgi:hypothetical protein
MTLPFPSTIGPAPGCTSTAPRAPIRRRRRGDDQFNIEQPVTNSRAYDLKPGRGDFGLTAARILAPGDPYRSTMFYACAPKEPVTCQPSVPDSWTKPASACCGIGCKRSRRRRLRPIGTRRFGVRPSVGISRPEITDRSAPKLLASPEVRPGVAASVDSAGVGGEQREILQLVSSSPNAVVRDLFERFVPSEQRRIDLGVAFDPQTVLRLRGDPSRGRAVFSQEGGRSAPLSCGIGQGRVFGPDLQALPRSTRNRDIAGSHSPSVQGRRPEFVLHNVETKDGMNYSGFVTRKSADELVLRTELGGEVRFVTSNVQSDVAAQLSACPRACCRA